MLRCPNNVVEQIASAMTELKKFLELENEDEYLAIIQQAFIDWKFHFNTKINVVDLFVDGKEEKQGLALQLLK